MELVKERKSVKLLILCMVAILSIFVLAKITTSNEFYANSIASLDEKRTTVMELTAASTAVSAAITLLPGDVATPIAEKLADLSTYFLVVICAIYLEKFLLSVTGYVTFVILIPIACACLAINLWANQKVLKEIALRLCVFGMAIVLIIPASIKISNLIENTYDASIQTTLETAKQSIQEMEETTEAAQETEEKGFLLGLVSKVTEGISNTVTNVSEKVQHVLNNFIEALAVMLVTSCIIPVLVILFFVWISKLLLGINLDAWREHGFFTR